MHWLRRLPCSQMPAPPHSLHLLRCLPCSHKPEPPHSLHLLGCLPCSQIPPPPHSLHSVRRLPCSQIPFPGHSLQKYPPLPLPCTHVARLPAPPAERGRFPRAGAMAERAVGCDTTPSPRSRRRRRDFRVSSLRFQDSAKSAQKIRRLDECSFRSSAVVALSYVATVSHPPAIDVRAHRARVRVVASPASPPRVPRRLLARFPSPPPRARHVPRQGLGVHVERRRRSETRRGVRREPV